MQKKTLLPQQNRFVVVAILINVTKRMVTTTISVVTATSKIVTPRILFYSGKKVLLKQQSHFLRVPSAEVPPEEWWKFHLSLASEV